MNEFQELWLRQAESDYDVLRLLHERGVAPSHQIHYLQMVTEKIAKAYFWRSGMAPPRSHAGFVQFLRSLGSVGVHERKQIVQLFQFKRIKDFQNFIRIVLPLAYALERLAPALAHDGPNPEYPWPPQRPQYAPVTFDFEIWDQLHAGRGQHFLAIVEKVIQNFSAFG
jgi:hypothetical protein